jgi:hypothetical protein
MESTVISEDNQIWSDFEEDVKGTYPKQNQKTHGFDFIPKHGVVPNVSAAHAKVLGSAQIKKTVGKTGKTLPIVCDHMVDFKIFLKVCLGWHAFCHYLYLLELHQCQNMWILDVATPRMIDMFD